MSFIFHKPTGDAKRKEKKTIQDVHAGCVSLPWNRHERRASIFSRRCSSTSWDLISQWVTAHCNPDRTESPRPCQDLSWLIINKRAVSRCHRREAMHEGSGEEHDMRFFSYSSAGFRVWGQGNQSSPTWNEILQTWRSLPPAPCPLKKKKKKRI